MPDLQAFKRRKAAACQVLSQSADQNLSICFFCGLNAWVVVDVSETSAVVRLM